MKENGIRMKEIECKKRMERKMEMKLKENKRKVLNLKRKIFYHNEEL